ncbi:MAG: DUF4143 domain-containing protein [Cellulomonadaceae bacterium]|jgi:predicted AAA+ superfamily ATPase|nr:DUF4143 domain-containing protein [Cellulomonadaceae bacterium]
MDTYPILGQRYKNRIIDASIQRALRIAGAVVIEGARGSGKTMSALNAAKSAIYLDDDQVRAQLAQFPHRALDGARPRLLDEWDSVPGLWNRVRREVDASAHRGQFILTGSAVPADDVTRHTGAGRFMRLRQRTMTWSEKAPTGDLGVSIAGLFDGKGPHGYAPPMDTLESVVASLLQSGFPGMVDLEPEDSAELLHSYIDDIARADVRRIATVRHEPQVLRRLIASIARNTGSEATLGTLAGDVRALAPDVKDSTIGRYVELLQRLFVVEAQEAWSPTLRSRTAIRKAPKYHLVDPALAAAAMGAGNSHLMTDLRTTGFLFESAVVHDLSVLASPLRGEVRHFRDAAGREIDAIITLPDGRWGAVEVKLGSGAIPAAIASLARSIAAVDTAAVGNPAFRLVITGNGPIDVAECGTITAPLRALAT